MKGASFPFDNVLIERGSSVPIQRQLYAILRSGILRGRLSSGSSLPPTRAFAKQLGIGRNTVIAAYDQLLAEGFVDARQGSGTWVVQLEHKEAQQPSAPNLLGLSRRGEVIARRPQSRKNKLISGVPRERNLPVLHLGEDPGAQCPASWR